MTALAVENLISGYGSKKILQNLSFEIKVGDFLGIVGPNGCGKTTLLRVLAGLLPLWQGRIKIGGWDVAELSRKEIAQKVAYVPQLMEPVEGFTVTDMILLGRTPYLNRFSFEEEEDWQVVKAVIAELKIENLANTQVDELSGGEFQRVAIARALAQEPKLILLDEPISHLDIRYQIKILKLLYKLRSLKTVISTFHDLNLAARFCNKLILMKKGEIIAYGRPDEILTAENIWSAYRIKAEVRRNPRKKHARLVFLP